MVSQRNAINLPPRSRFKSGDFVLLKSTNEIYRVTNATFIPNLESWTYILKDLLGSKYESPVNEDEIQPSSKPNKVTATMWEKEDTLCFKVEARGHCVARRQDNNFINGTRLLFVAVMTQARRNRILKNEEVKHVVKVGPKHLNGVWIPFDRALELANREKITDLLHPLFVQNIEMYVSEKKNPVETLDPVETSGLVDATGSEKAGLLDQNSFDNNHVDGSFFLAIKTRHAQTVKSFIDRFPELKNAVNAHGQSALNLAVVQGDQNVVKVLLEAGASINELDKQGRSPLSLAAQHGHEIIINILLDKGASVDLRDSNSLTALSYAIMNGHHLVAKLLQAKGAVVDRTTTFTDSGYASNMTSTNIALEESSRDDTATVYSFGSVAESERINYQLAFASEILKVIQPTGIDEEVLDSISSLLPDILKSFALKLGHSASNKQNYDAMSFIAKYRSEITSTLINQWRNDQQLTNQLGSNQMSSKERVQIWREEQAQFTSVKINDDEALAEEADFDEQEDDLGDLVYLVDDLKLSQETPIDLNFIMTTPAYSWLLSKLINQVRLSIPQPDTLSIIQETIRSCFPVPQKFNLQTSQVLYNMTINIKWHLARFLDTYDFSGSHDCDYILRTFVTLTSDGQHTQALTALQYLQQMWPKIGEITLDLVIKTMQNGQASYQSREGMLRGKTHGAVFVFSILGAADFIAEIGGILSWMGAVFRPSPKEGVVYECTPFVKNIEGDSSDRTQERLCTIEYSLKEAETSLAHCWHGLFYYATIAHGFPIMKRPSDVQGLEMSLGMMLALCQARHIGQYNDTIITKGFSSMFSLSEHKPSVSIWHFARTADDSFIPYPRTNNNIKGGDVGVQEILRDRHFVGWCAKFVYGPGSLDAVHQVQPSCLPRSHPGCHLFETSLRRAHAFPVESVCIAHNQQSPHITVPQDLHRRLERIHAKPVVFWDTANQRGWLTNGTSALLHLTLASVEKGDSPFTSAYNLQKTDILQHETNTENAAAYTLLNEQNLKLQIRSHLGQPVYLQDRIEDILYLLDLMMDQQTINTKNGNPSLDVLEGWEFRDVVSAAPDILYPRVSQLEKDCSGWLQLLKDTYAVTLFGEDFGELYKPFSSDLCEEWTTLPPDRYYLAAGVADLEKIAQVYGGNNKSVPKKLTVNTTWPVVQSTFSRCACFMSHNHSDLVQTLVPTYAFTTKPDIKSILRDVPHGGAVIFGPITDHTWLRPNYLPTSIETPRKRLRHDSESDFLDSGLGDSISSAPTEAWSPRHTDYHVAIICALPKELFAVRCLFDEIYSDPEFDKNDKNSYAFGKIASCKLVAACLPGIYGTNSATQVMVELRRSFPLEFCLLVGIAGGIPSSKNDIRLGDVVVSRPSGHHSGLIKYDFEKIMQGGVSHLLGSFNHPPQVLLSAIGILESDPYCREPLAFYIDNISNDHPAYRYPGMDLDVLYSSNHIHTEARTDCHVLEREPRKSTHPRIHYGLVASGDKLIKDAKVRDSIGSKYNALCFEMEGAGIANVLPSLVIRGISDYSDSQKNDVWQEYASATAAACAKLILSKVRSLEDTWT